VCALCADRAPGLGWLPADQEGAEEKLRAKGERRPGILSRLFVRPEGAPKRDYFEFEDELNPPSEPALDPIAQQKIHELDTERYDVEAEWGGGDVKSSPRRRLKGLFRSDPSRDVDPEVPHGHAADLPAPGDVPEPDESPAPDAPAPDAHEHPAPLPDPAGRGMRPRRLQPDAGVSPATRFERAIARFNSSDAGRTVAGLTRTLGAPSVSVGDLAGSADEVRVTVAWELTWYQWGVDLGDELRPVYELKKGFEVEEIDAAARQWNASAHDGRIVLVAPRRREAANGKPVHR
jgi:hypothetical protein